MIVVEGEAETPYYYHFDGLGSVIALSDEDANGAGLSKSSVGNPYIFTGRRLDNETDLYYYLARHCMDQRNPP